MSFNSTKPDVTYHNLCQYVNCARQLCLSSLKNNNEVEYNVLAASWSLLIPFILVSNSLFLYGLWSTKQSNHLSVMDKLLTIQSAIDCLAAVTYCPLSIYVLKYKYGGCIATMVPDRAMAYSAWIFAGFSQYSVLLVTQVRCFDIVDNQAKSFRVVSSILSTILSTSDLLLRAGVVASAVLQDTPLQTHTKLFLSKKLTDAALLLLVVTFNSVLLKHVLSNAMPNQHSSYRYEVELTKTIAVMNTTLICTWLPSVVLDCYTFSYLQWAPMISYGRFKTLHFLEEWMVLVLYANCGLNSLVYTLRIRKIRAFYLDKFHKFSMRAIGQYSETEL